jgi:hypothetical protein
LRQSIERRLAMQHDWKASEKAKPQAPTATWREAADES